MDLTEIRARLHELLEALRGDDEWSEEDRTAHAFLAAAWMTGRTDAGEIAEIAELDPALAESYAERARQGQLFDGAEFRGRYHGESGALALLIDVGVMQGNVDRRVREDGEVMYSLTPQGTRYVEDELLPEIEKGGE